MPDNVRIGIDLDDVIYDWVGHACHMLETFTGRKHKPPRHWVHEPGEWGLTQEEWDWLWAIHNMEYMYGEGKPHEHAIESLHYLDKKYSPEIVIITARKAEAYDATKGWLDWYDVPYLELHFTSAKWEVPCDIYVDDNYTTLHKLSWDHDKEVLLVERAWNTSPYQDSYQPFPKARQWWEITKHLEELCARRARTVSQTKS